MPSVQLRDVTIEYDERGAGEPILLVMGLGGQLIAWREDFCDLLAERGFRVIRFDNRDAGLSTHFDHVEPPSTVRAALAHLIRRPLEPAYHLRDMAGDAVGLLDALEIERAHVMGVSMGGMISQLLALDHPDRVISLTSMMSTTGNRRVGQPSVRVLAQLVRRASTSDPDAAVESSIDFFRLITGPHFDEDDHRISAEESVARSFKPGGRVRQAAAIAAAPDRTHRLRSLDVPTLVLHGMRDTLVHPSGGRATAEAIPGARLVMVDDMGHALPRPLWPRILDTVVSHARRAGAQATEKTS